MKVNLNGYKDKIENLIFKKNEVVTKKKKSIMKIDLCIGKNAQHVLQTLPLKIEMFSFFKSSSLLQSHKKFHKTCPISCMNQNHTRTLTIKKSNHVIIEGLNKPL